MTDDRWSEKLTWAFSSGELKSYGPDTEIWQWRVVFTQRECEFCLYNVSITYKYRFIYRYNIRITSDTSWRCTITSTNQVTNRYKHRYYIGVKKGISILGILYSGFKTLLESLQFAQITKYCSFSNLHEGTLYILYTNTKYKNLSL